MKKTEQKLADEYRDKHADATEDHEQVGPTPTDIRNGWTKETLNAYLVEQRAAQSLRTDPDSLHRKMARRPTAQNHKYNPHRWRG